MSWFAKLLRLFFGPRGVVAAHVPDVFVPPTIEPVFDVTPVRVVSEYGELVNEDPYALDVLVERMRRLSHEDQVKTVLRLAAKLR